MRSLPAMIPALVGHGFVLGFMRQTCGTLVRSGKDQSQWYSQVRKRTSGTFGFLHVDTLLNLNWRTMSGQDRRVAVKEFNMFDNIRQVSTCFNCPHHYTSQCQSHKIVQGSVGCTRDAAVSHLCDSAPWFHDSPKEAS